MYLYFSQFNITYNEGLLTQLTLEYDLQCLVCSDMLLNPTLLLYFFTFSSHGLSLSTKMETIIGYVHDCILYLYWQNLIKIVLLFIICTILLLFRMLASPQCASGLLNINCCDPLGRSALLMAIDNENLEMVELLLDNKVSNCLLPNSTFVWKSHFCTEYLKT